MTLTSMMLHVMRSSITTDLLERTARKETLYIGGATRAGRALIASALSKKKNAPLLVIVPTLEEAAAWQSVLQLMGWGKTYLYPTSESCPYDSVEPNNEIIWGQLQVLSELCSGDCKNNVAIVSTERSLQPHLPPKSSLVEECISFKKGDAIDIELLSAKITKLGYKRNNSTDTEGVWSRRGDIIDIYPVSSELPIRLELFGDVIDKLREFDPVSQKSLDALESVTITPTSFNSLVCSEIRQRLPEGLQTLLDNQNLDLLLEGGIPKGSKRLTGLAWPSPCCLLDYLPEDTFVALDEKRRVIEHCNKWLDHVNEIYSETINELTLSADNSLPILPPNLHRSFSSCIKELIHFSVINLSELFEANTSENCFDLASKSLNLYPNQFGMISQEIRSHVQKHFSVWIMSAQPSRTVSLLEEHDCISRFVPNSNDLSSIERLIAQNTPTTLKGNNTSDLIGFTLPVWRVLLVTDREIFGQQCLSSTGYIRKRRRASSSKVNPNKMQQGDYVVHRNHGIGRFLKIEKNAFSGEIRDYLVVQYLDGILRVAADQLGSLGRFRSTDGKSPKINKMGGQTWGNLKERAKKSISKLAVDLVRLYAERNNTKGYAFPSDGPWQFELEESFPYEPTPDQKQAVVEVKRDMERDKPMDRLVCGDVGYGKTEVAIRAVFKAITSGKQAAILAPTTVLAQQHWRTISDRFAPYPIKVSLLNRFKSSAEKKVILSELRAGKIDAVVGTHQILSKNVVFDSLGLLVVDEEQRFGVNQKEKIKSIKKDIDVLTLSATPIPRTLYMSLSGVREMSLITTPPPSRRPIKTHISVFDEEIIRSAICQELDRGGQIFYVVPRVEGIDDVALKLKQMIPNLNVLVAHGQMAENQLENAMIAFNSGEADLMLCTTIVESGLDIPRVNTILIEDSQKFGLSQLYQLRGRVGRSGVQAHAWLFYPNNTALSDTARQRLRAIQEFADLGSGYQLAMRDMEIRGVGNLLGVQQSGQMEAIGFDLYMELLQECLSELQGQNIPVVEDTQIDLQVTAFIPADWIVDNEEKFQAYRDATNCTTNAQLVELATIWTDKYGQIPSAVATLIEVMKLKLLARKTGFSRITQVKANLVLETTMEEQAFRLLRKGLPDHLHSRLIYKQEKGRNAIVTARGLGVLSNDKQIEQISSWLSLMKEQIPSEDGKTELELQKELEQRNNNVLSV